MPVHIGELTSDVTALDDEVPLTEKQQDRIVNRVIRRQQDLDRYAYLHEDSVTIRTASGKAAPLLKWVPRRSNNRI